MLGQDTPRAVQAMPSTSGLSSFDNEATLTPARATGIPLLRANAGRRPFRRTDSQDGYTLRLLLMSNV